MTTYSTSQIAKIVGLHPNTVRMYEEWELIHKPERKENGYRVFNEIHVMQFSLAKKAFKIPVLQAGLRKRMTNAVKKSAAYEFDEAIRMIEEYIQIAEKEIENAREAASISQRLYEQTGDSTRVYKRAHAAQELGLTIDTIRNWEMNGLIQIKRKENGYRVYDENDMNRLRIIRSLRCANYSLSAILRMLNKLEEEQSNKDFFVLLNSPDEEESIIYVCDELEKSLNEAIRNAYDAIAIIKEIKQIKE